MMNIRVTALAAAGVVVLSMLAAVTPSQAAPAADTWEFTGTISAPARSADPVSINVSGTAEVSQEILNRVPATITCAAPNLPQVLPHIYRPSDGTYHAITNGGLALTPIDDTTPASINGAAASLTPSAYELVLRFRCSSGGSWQGGISATPAKTVTIASLTSTTYTTHSCLTSLVSGRCTASQTQYTKVPSGTSVTFGATIRKVWSDGTTSEEAVSGAQALTRANTWSSSFSTIASSCDHATSITSDYQYRCEAGATPFTAVTVETISPRSTYQVAAPAVTPSFAVKGSTVTVSGTVQQEYSDGSYWPATTSTSYSVQFQETGSSSWATIVPSRQLAVAGSYSATFTMTGAGQVRTVVGSSTSTAVTISELTPTTTYQIGAPSISGEVAPRVAITPTASVKLLWSDNTYRNPPEGTEATLEFAPAFESTTPPGDLRWRTVTKAAASTGTATFSVIPQASGFWRTTVSSASGPTVFARVTGSGPSTLSATMSPAPGQQPFVGAVATYAITAMLTGYVGSEAASLFIDMGTGFERVAAFNSTGNIDGTFPVRAGQTSGNITPILQARDPSGDVLASVDGSPIFVDGIETYEIAVVAPTQPIREGQQAQITTTASGISSKGTRYAVAWAGNVLVQRKTGNSWATLTTKEDARGERLTLSVLAIDGAEYRVFWPLHSTASKPFKLNVLQPTGTYRLLDARLSPGKVVKGGSVNISVRVLAQYSDKKFYSAPDGTKLRLQSLRGGSWRDVKAAFIEDGRATVRLRASSSQSFRFIGPKDIVSKTMSMTVTVPQATKLVVDWPSTYYIDEGGDISVYIRTNTGSVWTGTTTLQLSYRYSTSDGFSLLDTRTYKGRKLDWGWGSGPARAVQFRVYAPSLGLSSLKAYAPR